MFQKCEILVYFADTFGTEFVTIFPWSKHASNTTCATFEIINASENDTAIVTVEYDIGLGELESVTQLQNNVITVEPNSYTTHKFDAIMIMTRPHEGSTNIIPVGASRIFISSTSPVSIAECIFITDKIGDCFTVLPVTMAGNYYSFSIAPKMFSGIVTAYFIPTHTDSNIKITTITKNSSEQITRIARLDRGSMIYAYNSSIRDYFAVQTSASSPILILLAMRTHLMEVSNESFACTMLTPLPDKVHSVVALRDDFDVHLTPLQPSENHQTQLLLSASMQNSQPFKVATFRTNIIRLINVMPNNISDDIVIEWNYQVKDAIVGYASNNTLFQLLRFETYQNLYSFLDVIPSYSQYLTGRLCFLFKNENESLFLNHVSYQMDTLQLDGKAIDVEYEQSFENPFRYMTMYKINTKNLTHGLHCLQSRGRYLLFVFGGSEKIYGYAYAFNAYPVEIFERMMESNPSLYRQDIFGVSFVTLFPWMTMEDGTDDFTTALTLDILNPHPYMDARVTISYWNESEKNSMELIYNITPYAHQKLKMSQTMMTKLRNAYGVGIYKSIYDSRITIKSSLPISVIQNCFLHNGVGDNFAVLPLKMTGQKYSFSLPKSVANNSHVIIYFLPSKKETKISITAKVSAKEKFYAVKVKRKENSPIFAYYGSADELSMNLWGDNPFQVIIALQKLQIMHATPSIERRVDFGCTMAVPVQENVCSVKKHELWSDTHYLFVAQHQNYSGFFTMTPSDRKCPSYHADLFPRKGSQIKEVQRLKFEPVTMQHYFQLAAEIYSDFSTINCRHDYIQIYAFGSSNLGGNYIDFVQSTAQYVTGRSHFSVYHYQNWVLIFMDKHAISDIEMNGKFISDQYIYEMPSLNDLGYFALQIAHSSTRLHYVQSTGHYAVHVLSDTLKSGFYQYFVTLGRLPDITDKAKQELNTNLTFRQVQTEKPESKLRTISSAAICSKNSSLCEPLESIGKDSDAIILRSAVLAGTIV
uniref:IgGFc_binding domain-containing protein n=1 Tax=Elaeophora elaphi TaxID=1147741 RepID=A0A0R3S0V8_9BILA